VVTNWRPISIKNCIYRIFTCLMARSFQKMNKSYGILLDHQKGFLKKTNECSKYGIMLNEFFHDAQRQRKNLVVTTINFTNTFSSVPHNLIMSTIRQVNSREWTQNIVAHMYRGVTLMIYVVSVWENFFA
jgi:hypothetical protein